MYHFLCYNELLRASELVNMDNFHDVKVWNNTLKIYSGETFTSVERLKAHDYLLIKKLIINNMNCNR